ncbi:MAG: hypothetical protein ACUVWX_15125, partial [Kiritimatiellia bacterium]
MKSKRCGFLFGLMFFCFSVICRWLPAADTVKNPKVLTDRAVDTSSLESIVAGIIRPGMSSQEKFLACSDFYRRVIFHHRYMGSDRREVLR